MTSYQSSSFDENPPDKSSSKIMPPLARCDVELSQQDPDFPEFNSSPPKAWRTVAPNPDQQPKENSDSETSDWGLYFQPGTIPTYDEHPVTLDSFSAYYFRRQNTSDAMLRRLNDRMDHLMLRNRMSLHALNQEVLDLHTDLDDIKAILNLLVRVVNRSRFTANPPKSAGLGSEDGSGFIPNLHNHKESSEGVSSRQRSENEELDQNETSVGEMTSARLMDESTEERSQNAAGRSPTRRTHHVTFDIPSSVTGSMKDSPPSSSSTLKPIDPNDVIAQSSPNIIKGYPSSWVPQNRGTSKDYPNLWVPRSIGSPSSPDTSKDYPSPWVPSSIAAISKKLDDQATDSDSEDEKSPCEVRKERKDKEQEKKYRTRRERITKAPEVQIPLLDQPAPGSPRPFVFTLDDADGTEWQSDVPALPEHLNIEIDLVSSDKIEGDSREDNDLAEEEDDYEDGLVSSFPDGILVDEGRLFKLFHSGVVPLALSPIFEESNSSPYVSPDLGKLKTPDLSERSPKTVRRLDFRRLDNTRMEDCDILESVRDDMEGFWRKDGPELSSPGTPTKASTRKRKREPRPQRKIVSLELQSTNSPALVAGTKKEDKDTLDSPNIKLLRGNLGESSIDHSRSDNTSFANDPDKLQDKLGTPGDACIDRETYIGKDQVDNMMLAQTPLPKNAGTRQKDDIEPSREITPASVTEGGNKKSKRRKKSLPMNTPRITRSSAKELEFEVSDIPKLPVTKPEPSETTRAERCTTPLLEPKYGRCSVCADHSKASEHGPAHKKRKG